MHTCANVIVLNLLNQKLNNVFFSKMMTNRNQYKQQKMTDRAKIITTL